MLNGGILTGSIRFDQVRIDTVTCRSCVRRVQRWRMRRNSHCNKHDQKVDPDGKVCQKSKFLESANLAKQKTCNSPYKDTNSIAQLELACLG